MVATFYVAFFGMVLAMVVVVPDWPFFNQHPIAFMYDDGDKSD
jgi:hypothetical protein